MGSSISVYAYKSGKIFGSEMQNISTLPKEWKGVQPICKTLTLNHCADLHISPDGSFLYASNRGHESIAIYKINKSTGHLTLVGFEDI